MIDHEGLIKEARAYADLCQMTGNGGSRLHKLVTRLADALEAKEALHAAAEGECETAGGVK